MEKLFVLKIETKYAPCALKILQKDDFYVEFSPLKNTPDMGWLYTFTDEGNDNHDNYITKKEILKSLKKAGF